MYLTRTAGIETPGCRRQFFGNPAMYLTRTAGIETIGTPEHKTATEKCILPALRELKQFAMFFIGGLSNVSYPHCGN